MLGYKSMIFLQDILPTSIAWKVEQSALESVTIWAKHDLKARMSFAKMNNSKFGFVLKTLKSC